jgi:hypothetical protein
MAHGTLRGEGYHPEHNGAISTKRTAGVLQKCPIREGSHPSAPWLQAAALDLLHRLLRADERTISHLTRAEMLRCVGWGRGA